MNRADERQRAQRLNALDARIPLKQQLPHVFKYMSPEQIDKVQRALDMAVVNPAVDKEVAELNSKAIRSQSGTLVHRDPEMVQRANKAMQKYIMLSKLNGPDWRLRLDPFEMLLTRDALKPTTDNPDEAGYLLVVSAVCEQRGIWLRFKMNLRKDLPNPMALEFDTKTFTAWLSLGPEGDAIPTLTGELNQKSLLANNLLGAGHWEWVHQGPTLKALRSALDRVSAQISIGRSEHGWWSAHRGEFPVVSTVSNTLGRAEWPHERIWDQPHQIYVRALHLISDGKLMEAAKFAQLAAYLAEWCGRAVHDYINATLRGATRAVKLLEVAKTAGSIAETILTLLAVGLGVVRLLSTKGAASVAGAGGQRQLPGGQRQLPAPAAPVPRSPNGTLKGSGGGAPPPRSGGAPLPGPGAIQPPPGTLISQNGRDLGNAIDYARQQVGLPPRLERTLQGSLALAENAQFRKAHKEFVDWLIKNPNASLAQKEARRESVFNAWLAAGGGG